jgi:hypothetical protein
MGEVTFCQAKPGGIATFDARYAPLYITTFRGRIELDAAEWNAAVARPFLEAAVREHRPVFYITDAREMAAPSATVRKYWADQMKTQRHMTERFLATYIVINSAILRGALTAIQWLVDRPDQLRYVTTFAEAVREADRLLVEAGHPPAKLDPLTYRPPSTGTDADFRTPNVARG